LTRITRRGAAAEPRLVLKENHMEAADAVIAVFADHQAAETAVKKLTAAGFQMKDLSVVGKGYHSEEKVVGFYNMGDRIKLWGARGAFYGIGIPKDSVIQYEAAVKADGFLVMARGATKDIARAKTILGTANASRLNVHAGVTASEPADQLVPAG
jgi:hypothetical protein